MCVMSKKSPSRTPRKEGKQSGPCSTQEDLRLLLALLIPLVSLNGQALAIKLLNPIKAILSAYKFEELAAWEANAPAVWMSTFGGTLLEVGVGVEVEVVEVVELVLELEGIYLVLDGGGLLLLLLLLLVVCGEGEGEGWALGDGEGEGDGEGGGLPPPKPHEPWSTPTDSEPK